TCARARSSAASTSAGTERPSAASARRSRTRRRASSSMRRRYRVRRMKSRELEYDLPDELIAQHPAEPRDSSRLLVAERGTGAVRHRRFRELPVEVGDALVVVNETRVVPARLRLRRETGGAAEVLLLEHTGEDSVWEALARPSARLRPG